MLPKDFAARLATSNSPEKEQRLCSYNPEEDDSMPSQEQNEKQSAASNPISQIQNETRRKLLASSFAKVLRGGASEQESFVSSHEEDILHVLGISEDALLGQPTSATITQLEHVFGEELFEAGLKEDGPLVYFNAGEDFEAARKRHDPEGRLGDTNAFHVGNKIYLNAADPLFREDQNYRDRALQHEITHYVIDTPTRGEQFLQEILLRLRANGAWNDIRGAVDTACGDRFGGFEKEEADRERLHEALSITMAHERHPYDEGNRQRLAMLMLQTAANDPLLHARLENLRGDVTTHFSKFKPNFDTATEEQDQLDSLYEEVYPSKKNVHGMTEEDKEEAATRKKAEAAHQKMMNESESKPIDSAELVTRIGNTKKDIQKQMEGLEKIKMKVATEGTKEKQERYTLALEKMIENLGKEATELTSMEEYAEILREWAPTDGSPSLSAAKKNEWGTKMRIPNANQYTEGMNASDSIVLDKENLAQREDIKKILSNLTDERRLPLEDLKDRIVNMEEAIGKEDPKDKKIKYATWVEGATGGKVKIHWLSIMDMVRTVKIWQETIAESYKAGQNIRSYNAALNWAEPVLDIVPGGEAMRQILRKQARSANEEETSKFLDYLKAQGFTYKQLMEPGGVLSQNKSNVNRAKACLEYAADHAWLYKMDRQNGHNVHDIDYEKEFGPHAFTELVQRNESGKASEQKKGAEKVNYHPDIPLIIEDIEQELEKRNLFAVRGMLEVLQKKAKIGESNTWGLTTLFRYMREHPEILKIMDKGLLDSIGGIGIEQSAWSLTLFKMQRNEIMAWKNGRESFENPTSSNFVIAKAITKIEKKLPPRSSFEKTSQYDRLVAKVLAGQTVRAGGKPAISIFMDDFTDYRNFWKNRATSTSPGKTDDDFFNADNGGSDPLLLPPSAVASILSRKSQGPYEQDTKARNFLGMVIWRYDDLRDVEGNALKNYEEEMSEKLKQGLQQTFIQDAACNQVPTEMTNSTGEPKLTAISNINILDGLLERNLITKKFYTLIIGKSKAKLYTPRQQIVKDEEDKKEKEKEEKKGKK